MIPCAWHLPLFRSSNNPRALVAPQVVSGVDDDAIITAAAALVAEVALYGPHSAPQYTLASTARVTVRVEEADDAPLPVVWCRV